MRQYLVLVAALGCSVPDKNPSSEDGGIDDPTWEGPIDTRITDAPNEFSNNGVAMFAFSSNYPNALFMCSIDGERGELCVSPLSLTLRDGSHTFSVRATDGAGTADDTPAEHVWTIDTVAPATTLTQTPPAADNSTMVTFAFTSNEANVAFECKLDSAAFTPCRSGDSFGPISDGAHAFAVRAKDRAGNVDSSPDIHAWQVDTSTPDTTLLTGPTDASPTSSATFTFVSPDAGPGATFQCALDGGPFLLCFSPQTYFFLDEGSHTFQVRVRDAVGNLDPTPATRTWTIDLSPPDTIITDGPSGAVPAASASFTFSSNEADVTFACSLDGGSMMPCTSPFTAGNLAQGAHTFAVRAIDAAGHDDPSPATASWTVDTISPQLAIFGGPTDGSTSGPRVTFMFTLDEGTAECSVDGAAFAPCANPVSYNLAAGPHAYSVRAVDAAGNVTLLARSWTVACAPPDATDAFGVLHLDDAMQVQSNAAGGASATLGTSDIGEVADPTPINGRFGGALGFDASDGDLVAWPIELDELDDLTIELWARPRAVPFARDIVTGADDRISIRVEQDSATTVRFSATFVASNGSADTATSAPVAADSWHWVLVSLREPALRLWVDGASTTIGGVRLGMSPEVDSLRLGGNYSGDIDEVWVSRSATTTDEAALARYCPL